MTSKRKVILKIATIPPVCLSMFENFKLSQVSVEKYEQQQKNLEVVINHVNDIIVSRNVEHGVRSVRWDTDLRRISKKRRGKNRHLHRCVKFVYNDLYDGVHQMIILSKYGFRYYATQY